MIVIFYGKPLYVFCRERSQSVQKCHSNNQFPNPLSKFTEGNNFDPSLFYVFTWAERCAVRSRFVSLQFSSLQKKNSFSNVTTF